MKKIIASVVLALFATSSVALCYENIYSERGEEKMQKWEDREVKANVGKKEEAREPASVKEPEDLSKIQKSREDFLDFKGQKHFAQ